MNEFYCQSNHSSKCVRILDHYRLLGHTKKGCNLWCQFMHFIRCCLFAYALAFLENCCRLNNCHYKWFWLEMLKGNVQSSDRSNIGSNCILYAWPNIGNTVISVLFLHFFFRRLLRMFIFSIRSRKSKQLFCLVSKD